MYVGALSVCVVRKQEECAVMKPVHRNTLCYKMGVHEEITRRHSGPPKKP